jgi:hypothetical protein
MDSIDDNLRIKKPKSSRGTVVHKTNIVEMVSLKATNVKEILFKPVYLEKLDSLPLECLRAYTSILDNYMEHFNNLCIPV